MHVSFSLLCGVVNVTVEGNVLGSISNNALALFTANANEVSCTTTATMDDNDKS